MFPIYALKLKKYVEFSSRKYFLVPQELATPMHSRRLATYEPINLQRSTINN